MSLPPVPCGVWTTEDEVRQCCGGLDPAYDLTSAIRFASAILYRLSGRRWPGVCERTVLPCRGNNCGCSSHGFDLMTGWHWALTGYPSVPVKVENGFVNCWQTGAALGATGCCEGQCFTDYVDLPGPIDAVTEVVIDGEILPATAYRVDGTRHRLHRVDGESWPCSNDYTKSSCATTDAAYQFVLTANPTLAGTWTLIVDGTSVVIPADATPFAAQIAVSGALGGGYTVGGSVGDLLLTVDVVALGSVPVVTADISGLVTTDFEAIEVAEGCIGEEGTWQVTYDYGTEPPLDGQMAAAIFACQVALDRCGGDSCLPKRLKEINREGVSMAFADPMDFLDDGKVGIYEVDLWLASVNPKKLARRAYVRRADAPRPPRNWTT